MLQRRRGTRKKKIMGFIHSVYRYMLNNKDNKISDRRSKQKKESYCTAKNCEGKGITVTDIKDCKQRKHRMRKTKRKEKKKYKDNKDNTKMQKKKRMENNKR